MKDTILSINLETSTAPIVQEVRGRDYIEYGTEDWKNLYPQFLIDLYYNSSTHAAIVNQTAEMIAGEDLVAKEEDAINLEAYVTVKHIEYMNIIIILTGSLVGVAYITELFMAWYSGVEFEQYAFLNRATGPYWWAYAGMMTCNVLTPQIFWIKKIRTSLAATFVITIFVNIGMWFERFVIIVTSLHRDFLPSSWTMYVPTFVEVGIFLGTVGF